MASFDVTSLEETESGLSSPGASMAGNHGLYLTCNPGLGTTAALFETVLISGFGQGGVDPLLTSPRGGGLTRQIQAPTNSVDS